MEDFGAVPLMLSGFSVRILERLHLEKSSRENKLQIPTRPGKGCRDLGRGLGGLARGPTWLPRGLPGSRVPHASGRDLTLTL